MKLKIVIDSFNILKKQKILDTDLEKKLPKKYNKVIFEEKKEPNLKKKN